MRSLVIPATLTLFLLGACNSAPEKVTSASPQIDDSSFIEPAAPAQQVPLIRGPSHGNGAVAAILEQANLAMQQGKYTIAAAHLERAVRIEPRNARIWHNLAQVRFNQGRYSLAASLASKSTLLAQHDPELRASNSELIKKAQAAFTR